ncbi:hypothetical protein SLA2020_353510 [Shorea laevis]
MPTFEYQNQFSNNPTTPEIPQSHPRNLLEYFEFKKGRDSPSEARTVLLLVASLVATSTFQMGLSPPGGTWQDNYVPDKNNATSTDEAHVAGTSILATSDRVSFLLFAFFNSIGFVVSLSMINILARNFPLQLELQVCIITMFITYGYTLSCITPKDQKLPIIIVTSVLPSITPILTKYLKVLAFQLRRTLLRQSCDD